MRLQKGMELNIDLLKEAAVKGATAGIEPDRKHLIVETRWKFRYINRQCWLSHRFR
jgi:hypothetical protein